jgi:hypothetical protein
VRVDATACGQAAITAGADDTARVAAFGQQHSHGVDCVVAASSPERSSAPATAGRQKQSPGPAPRELRIYAFTDHDRDVTGLSFEQQP